MSWSVHFTGKPENAKEALAGSFSSAKQATASVPAEQKAVAAIEQAVNVMCDHAVENGCPGVKVRAYGSACKKGDDYPGAISAVLDFQTLAEFAE